MIRVCLSIHCPIGFRSRCLPLVLVGLLAGVAPAQEKKPPSAKAPKSAAPKGTAAAKEAPGKTAAKANAETEPAEAAEPVGAVDDKALLAADANNSNWLMYGRTYDAHRYSPLKQIDKKN